MAEPFDMEEVNPGTGESPAGALRMTVGQSPNMPTVSDEAGYEALAPGSSYIDPAGNQRKKAFVVRAGRDAITDYEAIPEGATYIDPNGQERQKPTYEPLSFSAQTLYSMSVSEKEKRKALEKFYPGMVQGEGDDLHVDDNGTLRKAGRWGSIPSAAGMVSGNTAPVGLGALGGLLGAVGGTVEPGAGNVAGAVGGAMLGTMGGQYFNDILLHLAGTYDRTPTENLTDKAVGAASAAGGELVGRGVAAFVPSIKAGVSNITNAAPKLANKFLGTQAEDVARFRELAELGEKPAENGVLRMLGMSESETAPGISTIAKESPHLQNVQEVFNEAFDTSKPLRGRAETAYEKMTRPLLEKQGVTDLDDIVSPPSAVSTKEAGETVIRKAMEQSAAIDAKFAEELATRRAALEAGLPETTAQREVLLQTARQQQENASRLVRGAISEVDRTADAAVEAAAQGTNSGDLWQAVAGQLRAARQALNQRFRANANQAYEAGPRGAVIDSAPIVASARDAVDQMPAEFEARNPTLVRRLRDMGERPNPDFDPQVGGSQTLPPPRITFEELHQLRTDLRAAADYYDLPSDYKNGVLKNFARQIDDMIQGMGHEGSPFETTVRLLNENDAWFARERPIFNASEVNAVIKGLKAGEPADPEMLFKALVKPGNGEMISRLSEVIGPNLWAGVRAAQRQRWLQNSRAGQFDLSVDAGKFAREILAAHNDGTLFSVQGRAEGERMLTLAQQIAALDGKLPVTYRQGDTAFDIFRRAHAAVQEAEASAVKDPLQTLQQNIKQVTREVASARGAARRADPLHFLTDKSLGATKAIDKILGDEDLILAAAHRFGEDSAEFAALRQVWTERIFKGTLNPGSRLSKVSPEVQRLMMGVNFDTAQKIAEDMAFILSAKGMRRGDTAAGMSAMAKVEHPIAGKTISRAARVLPGANTAARATLGAYYNLMSNLLSSPSTARWLEKAYAGGAEERAFVRSQLDAILQRGGAVGTGAAVGQYGGYREGHH